MPFPILRLPFLALKILVGLMCNVSLVNLSLQSRRANNALKMCGKLNLSFLDLSSHDLDDVRNSDKMELFLLEIARNPSALDKWLVTLEVSVGYGLTLKFQSGGLNHYEMDFNSLKNINEVEGQRKDLKIADRVIPAVVSQNRSNLYVFWEDKTDGLIFVTEYFCRNFNMEIENISIWNQQESAMSTTDMKKLIDSLAQATVENVRVLSIDEDDVVNPATDENYKYILENLSATEKFSAHCETTENFKFSGMIQAKTLSVENGHWFSEQNLMDCVNHGEILIRNRKFSGAILIRFLEEWVAGKLPKLEYFRVDTDMEDSLSFLRHFEEYVMPVRGLPRHRSYKFKGAGQKYASAMSDRMNELNITVYDDKDSD